MLRTVDFEPLFDAARGAITSAEFDAWHEVAVGRMLTNERRLVVGWAAKLLNVYLKTRAYIAQEGRPGLAAMIHPPIDSGLWEGLRERFGGDCPGLIEESHCVERIKDIKTYTCYQRVIGGCRQAAKALNCDLIEVEQLWKGTNIVADTA